MDSAISKILSQVYELEGLLLVIDKHGKETPVVVYDSIRNHASDIHEMTKLLEAPALVVSQISEDSNIPEPPVFNEAKEDSVQPSEPIQEEIEETILTQNDDTPPRNADDEPKEVFTFNIPTENETPVPDAPAMRVDEKLQRSMSKDLRRAFSVNDRFRFRRELFGNNEADFVDAINMVEAMHSYDEATEYFLNDLGWDEEVPEVSEFLNIVRHHFDA